MADGSVEVVLTPGGDVQIAPNGDLLLVFDTAQSADATRARLIRLILTNARIQLANGQWTMPDDIVNPTWGASTRALVDAPITPQMIGVLTSQITAALAADPTIVSSPAPEVDVEVLGVDTLAVSITAITVTGSVVTIPSYKLPVGVGS